MPILNHIQRKHLSENVTWLAERRRIPMSLLADKALMEVSTLEKWFDVSETGGIVPSQDTLSRLAEALGVKSFSNLYGYAPREFQARYAADSAPTTVASKKPGPKPGKHYKRRGSSGGAAESAVPVPKQKRGYKRRSGAEEPCPARDPAANSRRTDPTDRTDATDQTDRNSALSSQSLLSDAVIREHLIALLENPLISARNAIRGAYQRLFPALTGATTQTSAHKEAGHD
jgi:hypothetical protein